MEFKVEKTTHHVVSPKELMMWLEKANLVFVSVTYGESLFVRVSKTALLESVKPANKHKDTRYYINIHRYEDGYVQLDFFGYDPDTL